MVDNYPIGPKMDIAGRNLVAQPRFGTDKAPTIPAKTDPTNTSHHTWLWWSGEYGDEATKLDPGYGENDTGWTCAVQGSQKVRALGIPAHGKANIRLGDSDNKVLPTNQLQLWIHYYSKAPVKVWIGYNGGLDRYMGALPTCYAGWAWEQLVMDLVPPRGTQTGTDEYMPIMTLETRSVSALVSHIRVDYSHAGVAGYFDGSTPTHYASFATVPVPGASHGTGATIAVEPVTFKWMQDPFQSVTRSIHYVPLKTETGRNLLRQPKFLDSHPVDPADPIGDTLINTAWKGDGSLVSPDSTAGPAFTATWGGSFTEISTVLTDPEPPGTAITVWTRYKSTGSPGSDKLTVGLRYADQNGRIPTAQLAASTTFTDAKTTLTMPLDPTDSNGDPITDYTVELFYQSDGNPGTGLAAARADHPVGTKPDAIDNYFDGDTPDDDVAGNKFYWLGVRNHSASVSLKRPPDTPGTATGSGSGTGSGTGTGTGSGTGTGTGSGTGSGTGTGTGTGSGSTGVQQPPIAVAHPQTPTSGSGSGSGTIATVAPVAGGFDTGGALAADVDGTVTMPVQRVFHAPTANNLAQALGRPVDPTVIALADSWLPVVTELARTYTGGRGFDHWTGPPNVAIGAVISVATARLVANPEQIPTDVGAVSVRGGFAGWTLPELSVLNRYRKRSL